MDRGGGGPNGQIVSIKRAANGRRQRRGKIIDEEREKYRAKNGSLQNTSTDSKGITFVILIDHTSVPVRKERLSPTSKARREASQNQFVEKGGMPDRVKSFREIDGRQDHPKARPGFVKPIRNGLRKIKNLIKCRSSRQKPAWWQERMELDSRKMSRRNRTMCSISFETLEVRAIHQKEAGESRGFPILCMGIMEDLFRMEGKECKDQDRLKM